MKIVALIARILLGLIFFVFGLNLFLHFLHAPPPGGLAGTFEGTLVSSHYMVFVAVIEVIGGALLLINRYIPLALTLLAAVIANILVFHLTMQPSGLPPGVLAAILWFILAYRYRGYFAPLLVQRAIPTQHGSDSTDGR